MSQIHRRAPDPEWVELYRRGMSTSRIAKWAGVPANTVRYHISLAANDEPALREQNRNSANTAPSRVTARGKTNMKDLLSLYAHEGRLPSASANDPRERALAVWLLRRRQDYDNGTLAPEYREGLTAIPGWDIRPRMAKDEARWGDRLRQVIEYRAEGNDWPRHKAPSPEPERLIGVWLQYQRTKLTAGQLDDSKRNLLDEALPGWRQGRGRGRQKRSRENGT